MPTSGKPRVNLDLLDEVVGEITVADTPHDVHALDGGAYRALYQLEAEGNTDIRPLYDLVPRLVPTLTADQVDRLNARQVGTILRLAGHTVAQVEDQFPNSDGPGAMPASPPAPA